MILRNVLIGSVLAAALGGCASRGDYYGAREDQRGFPVREAPCSSCGVVERIEVARHGDGGTTGAGAIAGGLIGAALGNQVGSGDGRRAATVAGAVAGGVAGHQIERGRTRQMFALTVRMDDGRRVVIEQRALQGVREGARVVVRGGSVQLM